MKRILIFAFGLALSGMALAQETNMGLVNVEGYIDPSEVSDTNTIAGRSGSTTNFDYSGPEIAEAITPDIQALARGLENDPVRIFNYVHDHIRHVLYFGSKKGAELTLLERSGNDFDQCALLVSLLRASGNTNVSYEFGMLKMPYDSGDTNDLHHWLGLSLQNTNWSSTKNYFSYLLGVRGYPTNGFFTFTGDTNTLAFHRIWVKAQIGGTNYYLDPAFKATEAIAGIDLDSATQVSTSQLSSDAGGSSNGTNTGGLNETRVRNRLTDYATNLVAYISANNPNAAVDEIVGGRRIIALSSSALNQSQPFSLFENGGQYALLSWNNEPTNLMTTIQIGSSGTNKQWYFPELQGARLALSFNSNGLGQIWLEDSNLVQFTSEASAKNANFTEVSLKINHPHGIWDTNSNSFVDGNLHDFDDSASPTPYWRTNGTFALYYGFEPGIEWLRARQEKLDGYLRAGLPTTSREVVSETLQLMSLTYLIETKLIHELLGIQSQVAADHHHRFGRVAQMPGFGYFIDDYSEVSAFAPTSGHGSNDMVRMYKTFDLAGYFGSAMEHGLVEQLQSSNLVGISSVKYLERDNAFGSGTYMCNAQTAGYVSQFLFYSMSNVIYLWQSYVFGGYDVLSPGTDQWIIPGPHGWAGAGFIATKLTGENRSFAAPIYGGYYGGISTSANALPDPAYIADILARDYSRFTRCPILVPDPTGADPVSMADGAFRFSTLDLSTGETEPRGITFARHYSPTRRNRNEADLGYGWTHNYDIRAAEVTAPWNALGMGTPSEMAAMVTATRVALDYYATNPNPKNWLVTAFIAKWGVDQLITNGVSITMGNDIVEFIRQPDGTYAAPAGSTMTLTKSGAVFSLQERHGRTFKFNSTGLLTNIVDQYSQPLRIAYDSSNRVQTITDWQSRVFALGYGGSPERLISVTNSAGRGVSYLYSTNFSAEGDLVGVIDVERKTNSFGYDANHQIVAVSNALSQLVVSNIYDGNGRVVTQYTQGDPNKMWQLLWSGFNNVEQDPAGNRRRFGFDEKYRLVSLEDALGNIGTATYDGQDHLITAVSPMGETNRLVWDDAQNVIAAIDSLGFSNQFIYDGQNNLSVWKDANGNSNRFGYNTKFQLTGATNGAGDWVKFGYNTSDGTMSGQTNSGGTTAFTYDSYGELSKIIYPGALGSEGFLNSADGDVLSHTNARNFVTSFQYNLRRQLTNSVGPTNLTASAILDAVGNVQSVSLSGRLIASNTWSATRKLLSTTLGATAQGTPIYTNLLDTREWVFGSTDPLQHTTFLTNDASGQTVAITDPASRTWQFGYNADGLNIGTTNAAMEGSGNSYSARGELLSTRNPSLNFVSLVYDQAGNAKRMTNRNSNVWQFAFDKANRSTNTITPLNRETRLTFDTRGLVSTVREPSAQTSTNLYDALSRLTNHSDSIGGITFRYDANGNLTNVVEGSRSNSWTFDAYDQVSAYKDADGSQIQYRYDQFGNLTNLIYPGNKNVYYGYDNLNRMTNVVDWASRQTVIEYDLAGRITRITRPNNTVREIGYSVAGEVTNIFEKTTTGAGIAFFRLGWTNTCRVAWEYSAPQPAVSSLAARTNTFDADNRLATVNGQNITNDLDGNMIWGPLTNNTLVAYGFDVRNRLTNSGGISYGYDPIGNRISITNGTEITKLVVEPGSSQVLMRIKNGVTNYYVWGPGLLYEADDAGNIRSYHSDLRGSTVAIADGAGNVTDRVSYSVYGSIIYRWGSTDTAFLFNGRFGVQSDANGLLYMRARYYNPYLCRFINADPSGFSGGLNFYAYADGNPVSMFDPFGLGAEDDGEPRGYWTEVGRHLAGSGHFLGTTVQGLWNLVVHPIRSSDALHAKLDAALDDPLGAVWSAGVGAHRTLKDLFGSDSRKSGEATLVILTVIFPEVEAVRFGQLGKVSVRTSKSATQLEFQFAPQVEQYALRATYSGFYPVMVRGSETPQFIRYLEKGDVWKFGTTANPATRYSGTYLQSIGEHGVEYSTEFLGTEQQAVQLQNMKIQNFLQQTGKLPPGNKIIN